MCMPWHELDDLHQQDVHQFHHRWCLSIGAQNRILWHVVRVSPFLRHGKRLWNWNKRLVALCDVISNCRGLNTTGLDINVGWKNGSGPNWWHWSRGRILFWNLFYWMKMSKENCYDIRAKQERRGKILRFEKMRKRIYMWKNRRKMKLCGGLLK